MEIPKNDPATGRRPRGRPRAFADRTEQNTIKSLDRAMAMLAALSRMGDATLTALAQQSGESPATTYRVLITLAGHGIVEPDEAAQTWHVGPGAFLIGSAFLRRTSLVERSRPALRRLMEETGETANLGIIDDDRVLFVSQVETHAPIRAFFPPGTRSAPTRTGRSMIHAHAAPPPAIPAIAPARVAPRHASPAISAGRTCARPTKAMSPMEASAAVPPVAR